MLSPTNSPFFQSDLHAVIMWILKLAFPTRSPIIPWILWSHKPSPKHDSNKYQSKAFCNLRPRIWWDQICDARKQSTYLVWLMFWVLSNQHYQHCTNQKLRSLTNAVFQNRGVCGQAFPSFPSLSPVIPFFCSSPEVLDELTRKRLLRRLGRPQQF